MSDHVDHTRAQHSASPTCRGQSFVEFALVLPMLLVLLLGIADFARIFSAGVVLEASARNAAEIAAIERLRSEPSSTGDAAYYQAIHDVAAAAACDESRRLPTFDETETCPSGALDGDGAVAWFVRVCVHDSADTQCSTPPTGYGGAPPTGACPSLDALMDNTVLRPEASYFVEVRTCYKFETIFSLDVALPMNTGIRLGDRWIERSRTFVVDCPVGNNPEDLSTNCPNP